MRIAIAATFTLLLLATPGATLSSPGIRDENRQILLAEEGIYDPNASVTIVRGPLNDIETLQVTKATALNMELDYLDAAGIRLLELLPPAAAQSNGGANPQPAWPALGTFVVREWGWTSQGARCPTTVAAPPEPVTQLYNEHRGTHAVGVFESSISEYWQKGTSEYGSSLKHTDLQNNVQTYYYGRDAPEFKEGWTLRFAFEAYQDGSFFCREETLPDRVRLTAKFWPFADRIDD